MKTKLLELMKGVAMGVKTIFRNYPTGEARVISNGLELSLLMDSEPI